MWKDWIHHSANLCCGPIIAGVRTKQNRSVAFFRLMDARKFDRIDQKFAEPGHSFLPNDHDFGLIEKRGRKLNRIFLPQDWMRLISDSRGKPSPFKVKAMKREDFVSVKDMISSLTWRTNTSSGEKVRFRDIRWMKYSRIHSHKILFRYSHSENEHWKTVSYCKRGHRTDLSKIKLTLKYPGCRPIKKAKAADLVKLCPFLSPAVAIFT